MIDDDVDGYNNELKPPFNAPSIAIDMETMQSAPRAKYNFIHFRQR